MRADYLVHCAVNYLVYMCFAGVDVSQRGRLRNPGSFEHRRQAWNTKLAFAPPVNMGQNPERSAGFWPIENGGAMAITVTLVLVFDHGAPGLT